MKRPSWIVLCLGSLLLLAGCKATAQKWVNENSSGKYILRGTVQKYIGMTCSKWIDLSDGFVLEVDKPGCKVELKQENKPAARQYRLSKGDAIVHSKDIDFLLSSSEPK